MQWFARTNPKMLVPSMKLEDGTVVNESRALMKLMDKKCPKSQQAKVERIMDIAFSCDLGWFSTVAMKKKIWLWRIIQESGVMEATVRKSIAKYADENEDLRDVYLAKLNQSTKDVNAKHNLDRGAPIQKCLNDLAEVLKEREKGEWVTGPIFTSADSTIAIYVRWVKWQIAWDPSLLTLPTVLDDFYNEVKDRDCFVKTLDVEGPKWVGFYWQETLTPVQNAINVGALAVLASVAYGVFQYTN